MEDLKQIDIYKDIEQRTKGDIYIGVVGPVRTGKSTFINNFMKLMVLPNIVDENQKERTRDELPQSANGRTIMTTEPKFVPNEAIEIRTESDIKLKVRLIDCVGYLVDTAEGHSDEDGPRMINTPWSDEKMPFEEAAEIGTRKVIEDHSTIGIVVTTDGTVTDIARENYIKAEERTISELQKLRKPFVIVLNTQRPYDEKTEILVREMTEKYGVCVVPINCQNMKREDVNNIIEKSLYEFPITELNINVPKWLETLSINHWLKQSIIAGIKSTFEPITKLCDVKKSVSYIEDNEFVKKSYIDGIYLGNGTADIEVTLNDDLFYKILSETTQMDIESEYELIGTIKVLAEAKKEYDKIKVALEEVAQKGYGIVPPTLEDMKLEEPELVKHGSKYGVKVKAKAQSLHLIRADIETEVSPIVGTEEQSRDLVNYLKEEMKKENGDVWELNMFGKSMHDLVKEGLTNKLYRMPEDTPEKIQETLQKIINEGRGTMICILL